jgi:hypothetical protein
MVKAAGTAVAAAVAEQHIGHKKQGAGNCNILRRLCFPIHIKQHAVGACIGVFCSQQLQALLRLQQHAATTCLHV